MPEDLYAQKGAPYWIPASALKPVGPSVIERLLSRPGFGATARPRGAAPTRARRPRQPRCPQCHRSRWGPGNTG